MVPDPVLDLFRRQHGLAARFQLFDLEPDPNRRRQIYADPAIVHVTGRVLRHRASPWSSDQEVLAAVLDTGRGAWLWSKSAATHWGFGRFPRQPFHAALARSCQSSGTTLAQVHRVSTVEPTDIVHHRDVPVARPEVVVLWLAGMYTHRLGHELAARRTATVLDHAWRQQLIDGHHLHRLVERSGGRGRSGIVVMREVLTTRPPDYKPAGSRLEERFEEIVSSGVRQRLRRQVTVDVEAAIRTVDYVVEGLPLVAEINGEAFHTSLTDRAADEERYGRLLELGFSVVVFWEYDVWHDSTTVRRAMSRLTARPDEVPTLHRPTPAPWIT